MRKSDYIFLQEKSFWKMVLASVLFFTAMNLFLPISPFFFAEQGMNKAQLGILVGLYSLGIFFVRLFAGRLYDRYGGFWLIKGSFITLMIFVLCYLADWSFWSWGVLRVLHGILLGMYFAIVIPQVSLLADRWNSSKCLPAFYFLNGFGLIFGNSFGSMIFLHWGIRGIIVSTEVLLFLSFLLMNRKMWQKKVNSTPLLPVKDVLSLPLVSLLALVLFTTTFAGATIFTFVPLQAYEAGLVEELTMFFTAYAVFAVLGRLTLTMFTEKIGRKVWLTNLLLLLTALLLLLGYCNISLVYVCAGVVAGFLGGIFMPLGSLLLSKGTDPSIRGTAFIAVVASTELGSFFGSSVAGILIKEFSYMFAYSLVALFCAGVCFLTILCNVSNKVIENSRLKNV